MRSAAPRAARRRGQRRARLVTAAGRVAAGGRRAQGSSRCVPSLFSDQERNQRSAFAEQGSPCAPFPAERPEPWRRVAAAYLSPAEIGRGCCPVPEGAERMRPESGKERGVPGRTGRSPCSSGLPLPRGAAREPARGPARPARGAGGCRPCPPAAGSAVLGTCHCRCHGTHKVGTAKWIFFTKHVVSGGGAKHKFTCQTFFSCFSSIVHTTGSKSIAVYVSGPCWKSTCGFLI